MEDYQVLANYIVGFEDSTVLADNSPLLDKYEDFEASSKAGTKLAYLHLNYENVEPYSKCKIRV